jgi:hypothetical protein
MYPYTIQIIYQKSIPLENIIVKVSNDFFVIYTSYWVDQIDNLEIDAWLINGTGGSIWWVYCIIIEYLSC